MALTGDTTMRPLRMTVLSFGCTGGDTNCFPPKNRAGMVQKHRTFSQPTHRPKTMYAVRRYVLNLTKSVLDSRTQQSYTPALNSSQWSVIQKKKQTAKTNKKNFF